MRKTTILSLMYLLPLCCILFLAQCASQEARVEKALDEYVQTENMRYPISMDEYTVLTQCQYFTQPLALRYTYLLSVPIPATDTLLVKEQLNKNILGLIKSTTTTKYFRDNNVIFEYRYVANVDGEERYQFQLNIEPNKYKQ